MKCPHGRISCTAGQGSFTCSMCLADRQAGRETQALALRSGGTVTITCSANLLALTGEDAALIRSILDLADEYRAAGDA